MVFGFFSRKQQTHDAIMDAPSPPAVPLPESPRPLSPELHGQDLPDVPKQVEQMQLRTPSPSIDDSTSNAQGARLLSEGVSTIVHAEPVAQVIEPTPEALTTLVSSVPAKTLHGYVLAQIPSTPDPILESLATFFATLTPPPQLHCVRCHKDFVEVENDDRSCLVAHDDESAEVERVGRSGHERRTKEGTEYETLWGCCGKTTEGDGSQGPPDGWCYEGKHTTDAKRARFRADSTPQDDKLVSCLRLNCHGIRSRLPRASSSRKRARPTYKEASTDDDASEGASDSGVDEIVGKPKEKGRGRPKKKEQPKAKAGDDDQMDVDADDSASRAGSASKRKSMTPAPAGTPSASASAPVKRPRGRPRKSLPAGEDARDESPASKAAPKRRGRPPKTKAAVDDSEPETSRGRASANASPVRGVSERPRTRSLSRTRAQAAGGSPVFKPHHKPKSKSRSKMAEVVNGESDAEADDEQPKKKRKVVS